MGWNGNYSLIFMNITKNSIIVEEEEDKYSLPLSMTFLELQSDLDDHSLYYQSVWS